VPQPLAHEHEPPVKPVAVNMLGSREGYGIAELSLCSCGKHLIGIEDKNPVVPKWNIVESPILLLRPRSSKLELYDFCAELLSNLLCAISARRVDNINLVRPADRTQAPRQICRFILDGYQH
jgi:hypothetical protein